MAIRNDEIYGDKCDRCGEIDEDRRTLHMSCLYKMDEMKGIPFKQYLIKGDVYSYKGERKVEGFNHVTAPEWSEEPTGEGDQSYYTLRVCKDCRADWMESIANWFNTPPTVRKGVGTGIYVRENGTIREITLEDWEARRAAAGK
jgi:hypothetical protein